MARIRPAKGQTQSGPGGARRPDPQRARPTPGRGRSDKAGTVTKAVQTSKGSRFFTETVAEMRKVAWPNRKQLTQATGVVLIFVAIMTAYLAGLDTVFERLIDVMF